MNARDLPCRVSAELAAYEVKQDAAILRAQRMQAWRRARESELECGTDVGALVDAVDTDDLADKLTCFVAAALLPDPDLRALKLRELTDRMIRNALDEEQSRWTDY